MPVIIQKWISRADLRANPASLYLFGDNCERVGMGGQAGQCRHEPNAHGIRTKLSPSMDPTAFFSDEQFNQCRAFIDEDLSLPRRFAKDGGTVVVPADGLGTGLSALPEKAPRVFAYLEEQLAELTSLGQRRA